MRKIELLSAQFGLVFFSSYSLATALPSIDCEIGIVGGGPAGLYASYRLAPKYGAKICLFEKEKELGGRLHDETINGDGKGIWVGTGARRVNEVQKIVLDLGRELGIQFEKPEPRSQLIFHNGHYGYSADDFIADYPGLIGPLDQDPNTTREDEIYALLLKEKTKAKQYPDLKTYIQAIAGEAAFKYLRGVSRFHADFDYSISASNYLDYLEEELKTTSVDLYPVGGMSAFIRKMESSAMSKGVRIFREEPVLEFDQIPTKGGYRVQTSKRMATVKQLILAVPPMGFNHIRGPLAEEISQHEEYQALLPIRIVVINQWWEQEWWDGVRNPKLDDRIASIWRAWSSDQCVNHVEIPQEPYAKSAKVSRSVYTDDPQCVKYWESLWASGKIPAVEESVVKGLSKLFNTNLTEVPVVVPKPLKTTMQVWPGGWYFTRAGTKVSNTDIARWSMEPIQGRKDLMLVGEAFWPSRPGWSEGAYNSVTELLKARFPELIH